MALLTGKVTVPLQNELPYNRPRASEGRGMGLTGLIFQPTTMETKAARQHAALEALLV